MVWISIEIFVEGNRIGSSHCHYDKTSHLKCVASRGCYHHMPTDNFTRSTTWKHMLHFELVYAHYMTFPIHFAYTTKRIYAFVNCYNLYYVVKHPMSSKYRVLLFGHPANPHTAKNMPRILQSKLMRQSYTAVIFAYIRHLVLQYQKFGHKTDTRIMRKNKFNTDNPTERTLAVINLEVKKTKRYKNP